MPVPDVDGMPAQSALAFSSWHVDEHPSPLVLLASSHCSGDSTTPSPQSGGGTQTQALEQSPGQAASSAVSHSCVGPVTPSPQTGESAATSPRDALSSRPRIVPSSPVVVHPPASSALENCSESFSLAAL